MDGISLTISLYHEVYNIFLFVHEVVKSVKEYESEKDTIRQKLEHEIFFLEAFDKFFLDEKSGGIIHDRNLPATYPRRVTDILQHLREALSVYGRLALKHYPPYQRLMCGGEVQSSPEDLPKRSGKEPSHQELNKGDFVSKVRNLGLRAWDWSLFDKKKLVEIVSQFREWTGRLKEIMSFSMLFAVRFKDVRALREFRGSETAKRIGLEQVALRQFLNRSKVIQEASPLEGQLYGTPVAVEYKEYGLGSAVNAEHLLRVKRNIRTLATLLLNSAFVAEEEDSIEVYSAPVLHTFQCIGYIDEPENKRMAFVFQLPATAPSLDDLHTLHAFIEELDPQNKPANYLPLEQKFQLAQNLCTTILNLHGSGWVHKSIRNKNIILLPKDSIECIDTPVTPSKMISYLTGFEFSRLALATTEVMIDFDFERNLYRHPNRQGAPTRNFSKLHDLYALGVVLLEIGVWRTVISRLSPEFEQARLSKRVISPEHVRQNLIRIAREELPTEMGSRYTRAVVACLLGDFNVRKGDPELKELGLAFREQVIEVMADGLKL